MITYKAKLYDVIRKVDKLGYAEKEKILTHVEDLHILLEAITDRAERLRTECPTDWSPMKNDIDEGGINMRAKYEETMEYIGKAAPVSIPGQTLKKSFRTFDS